MIFYSNYQEGMSVNWDLKLENIDLLPVDEQVCMGLYSKYKGKTTEVDVDIGWISVKLNVIPVKVYIDMTKGGVISRVDDGGIFFEYMGIKVKEGYGIGLDELEDKIIEVNGEGLGMYNELAGKGMIEDMIMRIITGIVNYKGGQRYIVGEDYVVYELEYVYIYSDKIEKAGERGAVNDVMRKGIDDVMEDIVLQEWGQGYWNIEGYEVNGHVMDIGFETVIEVHDKLEMYRDTIGSEYDLSKFKRLVVPRYYGASLRYGLLYNSSGLPIKKKVYDNKTGEYRTVIEYKKRMQTWQYEVIKGMGHKNVLSASRRQGKTLLSTYLAIRELLKHNYRGVPKRILYFGLTNEKTNTVLRYLQGLTKTIRSSSDIFEFKTGAGAKRMEFVPRVNKKSKDVDGVIELLSIGATASGVGEYGDLIILDEAARMPKEIYDSIQPIIDLEGAKYLSISTVYWDSVKNWFYTQLLKAERYTYSDYIKARKEWQQQLYKIIYELNIKYIDILNDDEIFKKDNNGGYEENEEVIAVKEAVKNDFIERHQEIYNTLYPLFKKQEWFGVRYTIDDIEWVLDEQKEQAKKEAKQNDIKKYYCEYYAVFPSEGKVFNTDGKLIDKPSGEYQKIYIGYDPAKMQDNASIVVIGYTGSSIEIIENYNYKNVDYKFQISELENVINEISNKYGMMPRVVMDGTGVGVGVQEIAEMMGLNPYAIIRWTSGNDTKYKNGVWYVGKNDMVENLKMLFDRNKIKIVNKLDKLIEEFSYYEAIKTNSGYIKYEAVGGTDDAVSATLVATYVATYIDGLGRYLFNTNAVKRGLTYKDVHNKLRQMNKNTGKRYSNIYAI